MDMNRAIELLEEIVKDAEVGIQINGVVKYYIVKAELITEAANLLPQRL